MGYHYNTYTGQMDNYTSSGYSLTDGSFNASAVQNTSSENTSYGYAGSSGAAALVGLLALFMLVALFTGLSMVFYELAMIWAQYHWPKAVALTVLAIIATLCARGSQSSSRNDPDAPARQAYFKSAAWLLWVAAIILPAGLSVRTLFFAPPLEVAVHKMNVQHQKSLILFNPKDFQGTGEAGVRRLLQEISNPDAKLELVVQGLLAVGPSGEEVLKTEGVQRLLQEIINPDATLAEVAKCLQAIGVTPDTLRTVGVDLLRKRWQLDKLTAKGYPKHDEAVLNFCLVFGEPLFPVLVEMADIKNPSYTMVLEAIAKMETGTPGIEQFTPVIVQHCFEAEMVWSDAVPVILRKHEGDFNWSLQHFTPTTNREEEGRYTALNLIRLIRKKGDSSEWVGGELFGYERYARQRKLRVLQNLPPTPDRWDY